MSFEDLESKRRIASYAVATLLPLFIRSPLCESISIFSPRWAKPFESNRLGWCAPVFHKLLATRF